MSRKTIETRLKQTRAVERGCFRNTAFWLVASALNTVEAINNYDHMTALEAAVSIVSGAYAVRSALEAISYASTASSLESVLAQDDLHQPDPYVELAHGEPGVFDQENISHERA